MSALHGYAIVRIDEFLLPKTSLENCVTVKAVFDDCEAAEREVERLNKLSGEGVRYFCQTTRLARAEDAEPCPPNAVASAEVPSASSS
jgi:hypothetical protein